MVVYAPESYTQSEFARVSAMKRVLAKVMSGYAKGKPVRVTMNTSNAIPERIVLGQDDFVDVGFAPRVLNPRTLDQYTASVGLSFHALGHYWHSLWNHHPTMQAVAKEGLYPILNMMDDARIELLMIRKTPGVRPYLLSTINQELLSQTSENTYFLMAGRTYVSKDIRKGLRDLAVIFHGKEKIDNFDDALEEFMGIDQTREQERLLNVLRTIKEIVGEPESEHGCGGKPTQSAEDPDQVSDTPDHKRGPKDPNEEGYPSPVNGSSEKDPTSNEGESSGEGEAHERDEKDIIRDLSDKIKESQKELKDSWDDTVHESWEGVRSNLWEETRLPTEKEKILAERVKKIFSRINRDTIMSRTRNQASGVLNARRVALRRFDPKLPNIAFDRTAPANKGGALDVYILTDRSGSVSMRDMEEMCGVQWALLRGIEHVKGLEACSIFWDSGSAIVKPFGKKQAPLVDQTTPRGGTDFCHVFGVHVAPLLEKRAQKRRRPVLIVLTDGAWSNLPTAKVHILNARHKYRCRTYVMGFGGYKVTSPEQFGADGTSNDGESVESFIIRIVEKLISESNH